MRYVEIETISFTDIIGNQYPVKEMREYPVYQTLFEIKIEDGDYIDEIASRPQVFGEGSEDQAYLIFEHNIVAIAEADWDLSKIKKLRIPAQNLT